MKLYAYFLPQFYPTPENDKFWGKGFTDWDNVKSARPLIKNHKQPIKPINGDYYDLSNPEKVIDQCNKSQQFGIDGLGYWHYWFGNGFQTLEKVPEIHLGNKKISQNFFFAWANTNWTKSWQGDNNTIIFRQTYSRQSAIEHFSYLKQFITDHRYVKINNRPLFQVLNPDLKEVNEYINILEAEAHKYLGIGFHWLFPAHINNHPNKDLFYSAVGYPPGDVTLLNTSIRLKIFMQKNKLLNRPVLISQNKYLKLFKKSILFFQGKHKSLYPCILSGWDNTPRYKNKGLIIDGNIDSLLAGQFEILKQLNKKNPFPDILFIKAWNEWAEGNILEAYECNGEIIEPSIQLIKFKNAFL